MDLDDIESIANIENMPLPPTTPIHQTSKKRKSKENETISAFATISNIPTIPKLQYQLKRETESPSQPKPEPKPKPMPKPKAKAKKPMFNSIKRQSSYVLFKQRIEPIAIRSLIKSNRIIEGSDDENDDNDSNLYSIDENSKLRLDRNISEEKWKYLWSVIPNWEKYQSDCASTLDEAIYCLLLTEPDFRGAIDFAINTVESINLSRVSAGLPAVDEKKEQFYLDSERDILKQINDTSDQTPSILFGTKNEDQESTTKDWFGNELSPYIDIFNNAIIQSLSCIFVYFII